MTRISSLWFDDNYIYVKMDNEQIITSLISLYPHLRKGSKTQLLNYVIEGGGRWVHWPELDEDLSAEGFLSTSVPAQP